MAKLIHVAVGVIIGPDKKILIAKRPQTAHQGGLWEFPGGKVDAGESVHQALVRELQEEISISVTESAPLIQIRHHYPDKSVLLDVYSVTRFDGEPCGVEGQPICWVSPEDLNNFEFPAANKPIINAIALPDKYLITGDFASDEDFEQRLSSAYEQGIRIVQLRLREFNLSNQRALITKAIALSEKYSARLLVNSSVEIFEKIISAYPSVAIGLHLSQSQAAVVSARPISADYLLGISCHSEKEIVQAQQLGADYLLLSPVKETKSHPDAEPIGWDIFASLVELANVPVYALGGMTEADLNQAKFAGAQGVAGISAWWKK
ncbi:MAG: hypothetical protein B0W54_11250 [Cellvibrio sp. 79]|nr:MAG: hypothetical protein B0W54_11250 [Cellvibrio sp. 79]